MKREGHTVLLTTHYLDEAEALCDRIAIIDRGRVIATGTPAELVARSSATQSVVVRHNDAARSQPSSQPFQACATSRQTDWGGASRHHVLSPTLSALVAAVDAAHTTLTELHVQKATLEDVFLELTADAAARDRP